MEFLFERIGIVNLFANGQNYVTFSIMGMLIVFAGLFFISLYIILLPKILKLPNMLQTGRGMQKDETEAGKSIAKDSELLLAVAVALHLEQTGGASREKITWKRHEDRESPWLTAGRMRNLAGRSLLPQRRSPESGLP